MVVGVCRDSRAKGRELSVLIFRTVGKMLERHAVISTRTLAQQVVEKINEACRGGITITVSVNLKASVPERFGECLECGQIDHPYACMPIEVAR